MTWDTQPEALPDWLGPTLVPEAKLSERDLEQTRQPASVRQCGDVVVVLPTADGGGLNPDQLGDVRLAQARPLAKLAYSHRGSLGSGAVVQALPIGNGSATGPHSTAGALSPHTLAL